MVKRFLRYVSPWRKLVFMILVLGMGLFSCEKTNFSGSTDPAKQPSSASPPVVSKPNGPSDSVVGTGTCKLVGTVVSAIDKSPISGAVVAIEAAKVTASTGADGRFQLDKLAAGSIALTTTSNGYSVDQTKLDLNPCALTEVVIALSPVLKAGQMRIVLTWGANPEDLDSHLIGPSQNGKRFHVWFGEQDSEDKGVQLDVDNTSGYGPETITLNKLVPGHYEYSVVDFSNLAVEQNKSSAMSNGSARVKVFTGNAAAQEFKLAANQPGIFWHVFGFDIDASGSVKLVARNLVESVGDETLRGDF